MRGIPGARERKKKKLLNMEETTTTSWHNVRIPNIQRLWGCVPYSWSRKVKDRMGITGKMKVLFLNGKYSQKTSLDIQ